MQKYFIIKYNHNLLISGTIVKYCTHINNCYLVENINNNKRYWLMNYDIYPIIDHDNYYEWSYNKDLQKIIPSDLYFIKNKNNIYKLLNNNSILDLDNNKEIIIDKNILINLNKL